MVNELAEQLRAVVMRLYRELRREVRVLGVTAGQVSLLFTIDRQPGVGVRELAAQEHVSPAGMSRHVTKLVGAGLVESLCSARHADPFAQPPPELCLPAVVVAGGPGPKQPRSMDGVAVEEIRDVPHARQTAGAGACSSEPTTATGTIGAPVRSAISANPPRPKRRTR